MKKIIYLFIILMAMAPDVNANSSTHDTIIIDNSRNLRISDSTKITLDRRSAIEILEDEQGGTGFNGVIIPGYKAHIRYRSTTPDGGDLESIDMINSVIGPVTENDGSSFSVLFTSLVIDANTIISGTQDINSIQVGDIVAASGTESDTGELLVTRLEVMDTSFPFWVLTGVVSNLTENGFDINNQHILQSANTFIQCGNQSLQDGDKVIVEMNPLSDYNVGDDLSAQSVICYTPFGNDNNSDYINFNGEITSVGQDQSQIIVDGITVHISPTTLLLPLGDSTVFEVGQLVTVDGLQDQETLEVDAMYIFLEGQDQPPVPINLFGEVSNVTANSFELDGSEIMYDPNTTYINGDQQNLVNGAFVDVFAMCHSCNIPGGSIVAVQIIFNDGSQGNFVSLNGQISNLNAERTQFDIDNEVVELNAQTQLIGIELADLANELTVHVEGVRESGTGNVVALLVLSGGNGTVNNQFVGDIINVNADQSQFVLSDSTIVNVDMNTEFIQGSRTDLVVGADVAVLGQVGSNGEVTANVIQFNINDTTPPNLVFFSGFISDVSDSIDQFTVENTLVNFDNSTEFVGGSSDDLLVGISVNIEGTVDNETSEVDATLVVFPTEHVSAGAPTSPEDVTISSPNAHDGTITITGLTVHQNELTHDFDQIFENGLTDTTQVVFFGYEDSQGVIWASTIFTLQNGGQGTIADELFIVGNVDSLDSGNIVILGVNTDTTGALFLDLFRVPISEAEFVNLLSVGTQVSIREASGFDKETNTIIGGIYETNVNSNPTQSRATSSNPTDVSGSGIVTRVIEDLIFNNGFR